MKIGIALLGIVGAVLVFATGAQAQDCRGCARLPSIAACMKCAAKPENGGWGSSNSSIWCGRNQPVCYEGKKKKQ
jgi:hypothetical protein